MQTSQMTERFFVMTELSRRRTVADGVMLAYILFAFNEFALACG